MAQTPTVLTIELTDALIPGHELALAGPGSITNAPAGNRFRIMDSGLAARAAPRNDSQSHGRALAANIAISPEATLSIRPRRRSSSAHVALFLLCVRRRICYRW